jgi:hypothetical protein
MKTRSKEERKRKTVNVNRIEGQTESKGEKRTKDEKKTLKYEKV